MSAPMKRDYDDIFKLLIIGDSGVGKSCLLMRFSDDTFASTYASTIGVDFRVRNIQLNNKKVKLQIWDTAGQERFATISSSYYRGVHGIMIVYDVSNKESFDRVANHWVKELEKYPETQSCAKLLIGNKIDVEESKIKVGFDQANDFANENGFQFLQTSAKNTTNVEKAFLQITQMVMQIKEKNGFDKRGSRSGKDTITDEEINRLRAQNNDEEGCACRLF